MQETKQADSKLIGKPLLAKIIDNKSLSADIFQITLNCKDIAKKAQPGQFVSILCEDLILRRPFSIANVDDNNFQIIYKVKGRGTEYISSLEPGKFLNITGPFGNGFTITNKSALLIGAGVGIAPVLYLSKILKKNNTSFTLLAGLQSSLNISELPENTCMVTEDGSSDLKGRINDYLDNLIENYKPEKIYACGPEIVLKYTVVAAKKYNIESEVSLEREFACGIGVCMGCSVKVLENNQEINKRICKDGPVFNGRSVIW